METTPVSLAPWYYSHHCLERLPRLLVAISGTEFITCRIGTMPQCYPCLKRLEMICGPF